MKKKITFKFIGETIFNPFQMIAVLFDSAPPDYYKNLVKDILLHTHLKKAYCQKSTSNMLFARKDIKQFIKLAYAIKVADYKSPLTINDRDLFSVRYYSNSKEETKCWQLRPVVLTAAEYKDPYLVFKTVYETKDFKSLYAQFKEAFEYGCSTNTMVDLAFNSLALYIELSKIIEACYLINVREVYHIEGRLKPAT